MVSGYVEEEERRRVNTNRQPLYTAAAVLRVTICKAAYFTSDSRAPESVKALRLEAARSMPCAHVTMKPTIRAQVKESGGVGSGVLHRSGCSSEESAGQESNTLSDCWEHDMKDVSPSSPQNCIQVIH